MQEVAVAWQALKFGGAMVYPLLALGVLAIAIIIDRGVLYSRCLRLPGAVADLVETFGFSWTELEKQLKLVGPRNAYGRFLQVIADNRNQPAWWVESRAGDEARRIEKTLARGLWVLETVVTAAPLLGLLRTITGLMESFNVIGASTLVAPTQVTAGVAQALIATALGLLIAIFALFGFNLFARTQSYALDRMERLGSRLIDHIRLDQENGADEESPRVAAIASKEGRGR